MDAAEVAAVAERGTLADGTPWPVPVTLEVPEGAVPPAPATWSCRTRRARRWLSCDHRAAALPAGGEPGLVRLAGSVTPLREPERAVPAAAPAPAEVRAELAGRDGSPGGNCSVAATRGALNKRHIGQLRHLAGQLNARLLCCPWSAGRPRS